MSDNQQIANDLGAAIREAEGALARRDYGASKAALGQVHSLLGQAFVAANELGAGIEWGPVAGPTQSGGTPKGEPQAQ